MPHLWPLAPIGTTRAQTPSVDEIVVSARQGEWR